MFRIVLIHADQPQVAVGVLEEMSRNRPNEVDDPLLASAKSILSQSSPGTFEVTNNWRDHMPAGNAKAKSKALKTATKSAADKGIVAPKHTPHPNSSVFNQSGVDNGRGRVVESGVDSHDTHPPKGTTMNSKTIPAKPAAKEAPKAVDKADPAIAKASAEAKAKKDAAAKAEKEIKAKERADSVAANKAQRDKEHANRVAAAVAAGSKRTYFGPMTNLADKVKSGAYQKGLNGQLRSNDDTAIALEACSAGNVVKLLKQVLTPLQADLANKYDALNIGQQSMNLRNKLRGFLKAEKITLEAVKKARDDGGFADAEAQVAARRQKQAEGAAKREAEAKSKADAKKVTPKPVAASVAQASV